MQPSPAWCTEYIQQLGGSNFRKSVITGTTLTLLLLLMAVPAYTETGHLSGQKTCLDLGHGGSDPGAVNGQYNLEEKDINLDVAYGLKALLEADGAEAVMTLTDDSSNINSDRYTFCNEQEAMILVSVHTNSVTDSSWDGSLGLYAPMDDPALARAIYDKMYPFLQDKAPNGVYFRDFGLDRFASGVLFKSDMPAAMMEPLFMSHPMEAELLITPIYLDYGVTPNLACLDCRRAQIAPAIHNGIVNYFAGPEPGGVMYVANIEMSLEQKRPWTNAVAVVLIVDTDGNPVAPATVNGDWAGSTTDTDTVTTDENGVAKVRSDRTRDTTGTLIFTVDDVSKDGWTYNPGTTVKPSGSISF